MKDILLHQLVTSLQTKVAALETRITDLERQKQQATRELPRQPEKTPIAAAIGAGDDYYYGRPKA